MALMKLTLIHKAPPELRQHREGMLDTYSIHDNDLKRGFGVFLGHPQPGQHRDLLATPSTIKPRRTPGKLEIWFDIIDEVEHLARTVVEACQGGASLEYRSSVVNAVGVIKYTDVGGVALHPDPARRDLVLSVVDTTDPLTPAQRKAFHRLFVAETRTTSMRDGWLLPPHRR